MSDYDQGKFDVLNLLSSAWYGKQYYFDQGNGFVYSRETGKYLKLDAAITEFAQEIGDDGGV